MTGTHDHCASSDEALGVRGGQNLPENFIQASAVSIDEEGRVSEVSANSAPGLTEGTHQQSANGLPGDSAQQGGSDNGSRSASGRGGRQAISDTHQPSPCDS